MRSAKLTSARSSGLTQRGAEPREGTSLENGGSGTSIPLRRSHRRRAWSCEKPLPTCDRYVRPPASSGSPTSSAPSVPRCEPAPSVKPPIVATISGRLLIFTHSLTRWPGR